MKSKLHNEQNVNECKFNMLNVKLEDVLFITEVLQKEKFVILFKDTSRDLSSFIHSNWKVYLA